MFTQSTDGNCPQCLLQGIWGDMLLNYSDFWECPKCHLQAHSASAGMFAVLRQRGKGDIRTKPVMASKYVAGWVLTKDAGQDYPRADSCGFADEADLQEFLMLR